MCNPATHVRRSNTTEEQRVGFLQPLEIPANPFDDVSLDLITGLPKSLDKDAILVVVDKLTKYAHFIATTAEVTALEVANLLFRCIVKHFSLPSQLIGDRDP